MGDCTAVSSETSGCLTPRQVSQSHTRQVRQSHQHISQNSHFLPPSLSLSPSPCKGRVSELIFSQHRPASHSNSHPLWELPCTTTSFSHVYMFHGGFILFTTSSEVVMQYFMWKPASLEPIRSLCWFLAESDLTFDSQAIIVFQQAAQHNCNCTYRRPDPRWDALKATRPFLSFSKVLSDIPSSRVVSPKRSMFSFLAKRSTGFMYSYLSSCICCTSECLHIQYSNHILTVSASAHFPGEAHPSPLI